MTSTNLTPAELAERWGLCIGTLQNWRTAGHGPRFIKPSPKRVLYPVAEIEKWERNHMQRSTAG